MKDVTRADFSALFTDSALAVARARAEALGCDIRAHGLLLFGAGNTGRMVARKLRSNHPDLRLAFIDDTPGKAGSVVEGVPVYTREGALSAFGAQTPVAVCVYKIGCFYPRLKTGLAADGFSNVASLPDVARAFADALLPLYFFSDIDSLLAQQPVLERFFDRLADTASRTAFYEWMRFRLLHDYKGMDAYEKPIYFPDFLSHGADEFVFVDCGAYDGDSVEKMLDWRGNKAAHAVVFEPDARNFSHMQARCASHIESGRLTVDYHQAAVGAQKGEIGFSPTSDESAHVDAASDHKVVLMTVDDALAEGGRRASYIKYDVEGFEYDALQGARRAIERDAPALAVSVYHKPEDIWVLPSLIETWQPGYRFYLRRHGEEGMDTVLYATAA